MIELKGLKGIAAWSVYNKVAFNLIFIRRFNVAKVDHAKLVVELLALETIEEIKNKLPDLVQTSARTHKSAARCIEAMKHAPQLEKRLMLLEALSFCDLDDDEVYRLLAIHKDENGIPYSKANINNFKVVDSTELIIQTLIACSDQYVDLGLLTGREIDDLDGYRVDIRSEAADILGANSDMSVGELLSLAIKKALKIKGG
jgi:hypothetical protein